MAKNKYEKYKGLDNKVYENLTMEQQFSLIQYKKELERREARQRRRENRENRKKRNRK